MANRISELELALDLQGVSIPVAQGGLNKRITPDMIASMEKVTTYGVRIDTTNPNPLTSVIYTDDAATMAPSRGNNGSYIAGDLDSKFPFSKIRPCLFKDGAVVGYLNKANFAQFNDGAVADITSGTAGDVMIEIPKFYYKFSKTGSFVDVKISNVKQEGFTDFAFSYKGAVKDKFYVGAYLGSFDGSNKLRSLSGKAVQSEKTISEFRTAAQANGAGYEQLHFNKLTALQVLYLIQFKSLNSQLALGQGNVSGGTYKNTGANDTKGMSYGTTTDTEQMKFNGIEDFWGNLSQWVDGYVAGGDGSGKVLIADGNFNDTGLGYAQYDVPAGPAYDGGSISAVAGGNETGFTPSAFSGSDTTFYSDYGYLYSGYLPRFGGSARSGSSAGAFGLGVSSSADSAYDNRGVRLLYVG